MAKIVVMGAGIGGISQIYELRKELGKEHELILVGDSDSFEFTPSNPWVAVGWRKEKQIKIDLPDLMKKYGIGFSLSLIHISEPTRPPLLSRMPSSA